MKKLLIIHGWDYNNYTSSGSMDAWSNRHKFTNALAEHFEITRLDLPGFGGVKDPEHPWTISDFANYLNLAIEREKPEAVLGYSFGGAILLRWKAISGNKTIKTFLISPAIIRNYKIKKVRLGFLGKVLPGRLISLARDFYLTKIIKNPYYAKASPIMRETYRNIVGLDLRKDLLEVQDELTLIYGEKDTATPPGLVNKFLAENNKHHKLHVIKGGGHDIANTHTAELVSIIKNMLSAFL